MRRTAAAVLIGECGRFLLQRRDDVPQIIFPGMIGLFGGHIEDGESEIVTVQREVAEETGYAADEKDFEPLLTCDVPLPCGARLGETVFLLRDVPSENLKITEGTLLRVDRCDLPNYLTQMTPATAAAIQSFLICQSR